MTRPKTLLALYGSPRKNSISSALHDVFLEPFAGSLVVRKFSVYDLNISPCTACGHCRDEFSCVHDDDMTALYGLLLQARFISISTPIYFSSLPGPLKNLIDRCQVIWELSRRDCLPHGRDGMLIAVGEGDYPRMFVPAAIITRHFFNTIDCACREEDYLLFPRMQGVDAADLPPAIAGRVRAAGVRCRDGVRMNE